MVILGDLVAGVCGACGMSWRWQPPARSTRSWAGALTPRDPRRY